MVVWGVWWGVVNLIPLSVGGGGGVG